jgi:hypothetical protein
MRPPMRLPLPLAILAATAAIGAFARPAAPPPGITATPVALDPADPARNRVGALRYLGGWALSARDKSFGGISSMVVRGGRVLALSDAGTVLSFTIDARGAITQPRLFPLPDGPGSSARKKNRDSESLQQDPVSGRLWVGFEDANAIWRYAPGFTRAERQATPPAMRGWPGNGGPEAMARLADGRFIVFSEEQPGLQGSTAALLFPGDPTDKTAVPLRFGYRAPAGYRVTDAGQLPDGRIVLLNRRFTLLEGVSAVVTIADPRAIAPGRVLVPRELARLASPLTVDNMEALSIDREGRRTILWIASDDNFNGLQRTLLLKFALEEGPPSGGP